MSWYDPDKEDTTIYKVAVNHEEQYSIWPEYKEIPLGWKDVGKVGLKPDCLAFIKEVWTDMRPLSLRRKMEEMAKNPPPPPPLPDPNRPREKSLVSNRLVASPACLVGTEMDYSPQMERLLQKGKGGGPRQRRILKLNPNHEIFVKLQKRFRQNEDDKAIGEYAELLLGYALLAEGSEIPEPTKFNRLVVELMLKTL
jgi:MbtH protein